MHFILLIIVRQRMHIVGTPALCAVEARHEGIRKINGRPKRLSIIVLYPRDRVVVFPGIIGMRILVGQFLIFIEGIAQMEAIIFRHDFFTAAFTHQLISFSIRQI